VQAIVELDGVLKRDLLEEAIELVIGRHEALRTVLCSMPGMVQPVQVVNGAAEAQASEARMKEHGSGLCDGVDLGANQPSFALIEVDQNRHKMTVSAPAYCMDFKSAEIVVREIAEIYTGLEQGTAAEIPPALQYPDIAEWLNEIPDAAEAVAGRKYWRQISARLEGSLPQIAGDEARQLSHATRSLSIPVSRSTAQSILAGEAAGRWNTGDFLLMAWAVLLKRAGYETSCIAISCDGRTQPGLSNAVGPLTRFIPVVYDLDLNSSIEIAAAEMAMAVASSLNWQDCFLWEDFEGEEQRETPSYFPVCFDYVTLPRNIHGGPLRFTLESLSGHSDLFDLNFGCRRKDSILELRLDWNPERGTEQEAVALAKAMAALLQSAVERPRAEVADLLLMDAGEQARVLAFSRSTSADYSGLPLVHTQFAAQAAKTPDRVALRYRGSEMTYTELERRASVVARELGSRGVGPESLIGVCLERSFEMVIALLGVLKAGGAYVPLDPDYPAGRLAHMARNSVAGFLLVSSKTRARLPEVKAELIDIAELLEQTADYASVDVGREMDAENPCYVLFTSGSTGEPKGVVITHGGLRNHMAWIQQQFQFVPQDRLLQKTVFSFDASVWEFYAPLLTGGCLVIAEPGGHQDADYMFRCIKEEHITLLQLVPTQLRMLLAAGGLAECSSLTKVFLGGEACDGQLVRDFYSQAPWARLYNLYGPTEATIDTTWHECSATCKSAYAPIGLPVTNFQAFVLDPRMQPVPAGFAGELFIGGPGLARGYLNRPEYTAEKFVPDPFEQSAGARLYRTGDHAKWREDGTLDFIGRVDHQVKIRGFRIELGEIEAALREHPGIESSVVLAREDAPGERRLVAYIVSARNVPSLDEIRDFLKARLPEYMVPGALIPLDSLPLTANGKIDRKSLPQPAQTVAPNLGPVTFHTPVAEILCGIWARLLHLDHIDVEDNFFDLGGHSLIATQVISQIKKVFNVEVRLRQLFDGPTVTSLAQIVEVQLRAAKADEAPPLVPVAREGGLPLSFAQQRMWFINQLEPGNSAYNIASGVRMSGALNVQALRRTVEELVRRHESLRTSFPETESEPFQHILPAAEALQKQYLYETSLKGLQEWEQEAELRRLAQTAALKPFDLANGPLLRATLVELNQDEHVLLTSMHHIVSDGWSLGVMVREVAALYECFVRNKPSPLPDLPVQYADYAVWQRQWLQGPVLDKLVRYWRGRLEGIPVLNLPADHLRSAKMDHRAGNFMVRFDREQVRKLEQLSRQEGVTLFMVLLAAFQIVLSRWSGQDEITVGTDIANRLHAELEDLLGFFVNQLALRTDLSGNPSLRELLQQVRENCLGAYAHQDLPFERLVEELNPRRSLNTSPIFQVKLLLQNLPKTPEPIAGVRLTPLPPIHSNAQFDLLVNVFEEGECLTADCIYAAELFEAGTIQRLLGHWEHVLEQMAQSSSLHIQNIEILREAERHQLLMEWNQTEREYPRDTGIHRLFEKVVEEFPNAAAVTYEDESLTYQELNTRANQLARYLQDIGVAPETPIALCFDRGLDVIVALLGTLKSGAAYVPLDPAHPLERLAFVLDNSGALVLLTQSHLRSRLPLYRGTELYLDELRETLNSCSGENLAAPVAGENLAYIIHTSGSMGMPKGTEIAHAGLCNLAMAQREHFKLTNEDAILQFASFTFDAAIWECLMALCSGGRLVLADPGQLSPKGELERLIRGKRVNVVTLPPSVLAAAHPEDLPELKTIIAAGETCSAELVKQWGEGRKFFNAYGPTEGTVCASISGPLRGDGKPYIGRPIANIKTYVLDRQMRLAPVGVPGELYIAGVGLARSYLNRPDLTAERFLPNPFSQTAGTRLYRTGDVARWLANGVLDHIGRMDYQVKIRGHRIEPEEIAAVLRQHDQVRDAFVAARDFQSGEKRLIAYVVTTQASPGGPTDLRNWVKQKLPEYMVPSAFLQVDSFPLTSSGKVDQRALPEPGASRPEMKETYAAPATLVEGILCRIWADVLGLEQVGTADNFFELGGHSLLATQVASQASKAFGVDVELRWLFETPTISSLAEGIEKARNAEQIRLGPPLVPLKRWKGYHCHSRSRGCGLSTSWSLEAGPITFRCRCG